MEFSKLTWRLFAFGFEKLKLGAVADALKLKAGLFSVLELN